MQVVKRTGKQPLDKTHVSTATIVAGLVFFTSFYALFVFAFHHFFGLKASLWYALSLPPASMVAHYYLSELRGLVAGLRTAWVLLRAPAAGRRLRAERAELLNLIEAERRALAGAEAGTKDA